MNGSGPIRAAGWISTPVIARLAQASAIRKRGTPASFSAWAARWARIAWTPPQLVRISSDPTPRAAGSRSRAAARSRRTSPETRFRRPSPSTASRLRHEPGERHVALAPVGGDGDDVLSVHLRAGGDVESGTDRRPRGDAHQKAVAACRLAGGLERGPRAAAGAL